MALAILFNATVAAGGTNQALDPSGVEALSYSQTLVIKALASNTGLVYIQNSASAAATSGYPLAAGETIVLQLPSTGLFVNGTVTGDKYGVAAS